jgi:hypothetical protein
VKAGARRRSRPSFFAPYARRLSNSRTCILGAALTSLPLLGFSLLFSCRGATRSPAEIASRETIRFTLRQAIEELERSGLRIEVLEEVEQPFFTRKARILGVPGGQAQIYEFVTADEAERRARTVSRNGASIGPISPAWMAPPHYFRRASLVVIYLGSDARTRVALERVFGPQFAGAQ